LHLQAQVAHELLKIGDLLLLVRDDAIEIFEQILEEDPDQMIEFLEQLELQDGE
jgi:hypothetical protein